MMNARKIELLYFEYHDETAKVELRKTPVLECFDLNLVSCSSYKSQILELCYLECILTPNKMFSKCF